VSLNCLDCHSQGYTGTPTACNACHLDDYTQATNPIHNPTSFSQICTECHTTAAWSPSTFNHNTQTSWPLTGAHVATACNLCHIAGQYLGTPTVCFFCHQNDYLNTTNPNHQAAMFPTDCEMCHTTITWLGATFDHDNLYFPIYSGTHREAWVSCTDCHIGGNYNDFSCIDCHEHNQIEMNQQHQGVSGYIWESHACFECHPDGKSGGLRRSPKHPDHPEGKKP
jgi:hypothetical protein